MKKAMWAAAIGAWCAVYDAAALDARTTRTLLLDMNGLFGGTSVLMTIELIPLGENGDFCEYQANLNSPLSSPSDIEVCVLRELRTPFGPSCIANELMDFTTLVQAGPDAPFGATVCFGTDYKGDTLEHATLLLAESPAGLQGVELVSEDGSITVYPVRTP